MKVNFIFTLSLIAALVAVGGCAGQPRVPAAGLDGGDAQRLVSLLDYVGGDYRQAVRGGAVLSPSEYEEQLRFVSDAEALARRLLAPEAAGDDPVLRRVAEAAALVQRRADPDAVARACRAAREEAVVRFRLRTMPRRRPDLERAQALYAQNCTPCHGARGDADTERARTLDPHPVAFRDPGRLLDLSPYRVYNVLTFGVSGTAMASFGDALTPEDRWSLAFYVFRLGHEGQPARGPVHMTLADLALRTDREVLRTLTAAGHPAPAAGLVEARRATAFSEPPAGVGIDRTRQLLASAREAFDAGRPEDADRLALDAYLQGFEPLEPRLTARDPRSTRAVESDFRDFRAAIARNDAAALVVQARRLDAQLAAVTREPEERLPFLAAFVIYLREGAEAALLVGALLAGVRRLGRRDAARYVHLGWMAALPAGVLTWWALARLISEGAPRHELVEAMVSLLAAVVLFSVSFWMISKAESRRWVAYLRSQMERSLGRRNVFLLAAVAFLAVYREAAETILFTQALLLDSSSHASQVWMGAAAGAASVIVLAVATSRSVAKLPLGPFFAGSSVLLCLLAVSFAGSGIYELVAGGYLTPRPVAFPEIPWIGVHPDLTGLLVQLAIIVVLLGAGAFTVHRASASRPAPGS
jgi:high-affinity iron transporter